MTEKELQDLIGLKKYEQPGKEYFDDFLVEFQERQRSEMLKTSARRLLIERAKAWFSELGSIRWVIGGAAAYAAVAFLMSISASTTIVSPAANGIAVQTKEVLDVSAENEEVDFDLVPVSMVFTNPVDFSSPSPAFSEEEKFF